MYLVEKIQQAVEYLEQNISVKPEVAIILGSGLGALADYIENAEVVKYADIPFWPRSTVIGHAGRLVVGYLSGKPVIVMQGRVHYYEGYTMEEVVFPTRVLGRLGAKSLVVTNASGGINTEIPPGTLYVITDHVNFMGTNPLIGENLNDFGSRFPDMTHAYDAEYIKKMETAAAKENIRLERGVYMGFSGPSFETPAEIRMARTLGADLAGMSTVPEVIVANHMSMRVCGISCVANFAAGIKDAKLTHMEVLEAMSGASDSIIRLIRAFMAEI